MTIEELLAREAIRDLMAKYTVSGDRLKVDDYVSCFTEDGIMESERAPGEYLFRYVGWEAIRDWQARWRDRDPGQAAVHDATFVRHHLSTCKIDLIGPDSAKARSYWVAWSDVGPDHAGYYLDEFRKVDGIWLIARRSVRLDWVSLDSLFETAIENTRAEA
ncbi:MAG TPA: nuclear transport factor 2 family protein [Sphingobium sp.]|uniref:nuclear transport factor 2 family protein n=1 Tax=Sphingobium sp. TaxID=1912891 RepID=UPI002ED3330A